MSLLGAPGVAAADAAGFAAVKPALSPDRLDSWLAVGPDGRVTAFFGKIDQGQGVDVAVAQVVAEELDVALAKVVVVMGDTLPDTPRGINNQRSVPVGAVVSDVG